MITADNDTPWGYGLIRIDRNSNLIWAYHGAAHHDLHLTPDGRLVTLTHDLSEEDIPGLQALERPWLDDFLVALDQESGEELNKVSLSQAFIKSRFAEPLYRRPATPRAIRCTPTACIFPTASKPPPSLRPRARPGRCSSRSATSAPSRWSIRRWAP
ncbi:arylsulfotransferase family protein [Pseudomonas stutzeri]|nr:arylsulfotransferase family protein [Stutzerimonas stutzeri]